MNRTFRTLPLALAACLALSLSAGPLPAQQSSGDQKLIILGFDGADAKLTQQWMDEGKLPNLAKLRGQGTFAPLRSTIPSQTPVSWSTFSTGLSPGRHGVFDFLKRDPKTYTPSFAAFDEGKEPFLWGTRTPWILGALSAAAVLLLFFLALKIFRVRTVVAAAVALTLAVAAGGGAGVAADRLLPKEKPVAKNRQVGDTFWALLGKQGKRVQV